MNVEDWQRLYDSLDVSVPDWSPAAEKPTPQALDEYENSSGFKLPLSYRCFVQVFGPGELGQEFRIFAPGYESLGEHAAATDLGRFNASKEPLRADPQVLQYYEDQERISRLVFFASTDGGEIIGWDPLDVRDRGNCEYGIYIILNDRKAPELLAKSFTEFVHDVCLGNGYFRFFSDETEWNEDERGSQRVFWGAVRSPT